MIRFCGDHLCPCPWSWVQQRMCWIHSICATRIQVWVCDNSVQFFTDMDSFGSDDSLKMNCHSNFKWYSILLIKIVQKNTPVYDKCKIICYLNHQNLSVDLMARYNKRTQHRTWITDMMEYSPSWTWEFGWTFLYQK